MGRFEIILVLIGIVWTVVSAVAQKKAKAAKLASMQAEDPDYMPILRDEYVDPDQPADVVLDVAIPDAQPGPFQKLREMRLAQLRSKSSLAQFGGVASGTPIRVPPQIPAAPSPEEMLEPRQAEDTGLMPPIDEHDHEEASSRKAPREGSAVAQRLRYVLGDRLRVREAILLNELLSKPLSIRETSRS
jgi:hypothetical protein